MEQHLEETPQRGFSKALKTIPVRIDLTVRDPETGTKIRMQLGFRRMKSGEAAEIQREAKVRKAAKLEMTMADVIDMLAPLFLSQRGIEDFETAPGLTPEAKFRAYFGGFEGETEEDLDVEEGILRACYVGYLQGCFRLVPSELVEAVSHLLGRDGSGEPVEGDPGRPVV